MSLYETIKEYRGKLGTVTIQRWNADGHYEYRVEHSYLGSTYWCKDEREAIVHAQFLAGKY